MNIPYKRLPTSESTFSAIIYNAYLEDIDVNFNFQSSQLNSFRKVFISKDTIDYDIVNNHSSSSYGKINEDIVFFNFIDTNSYEVITVKNNICYYRLVFDPYL
jgi:hypothetical protein